MFPHKPADFFKNFSLPNFQLMYLAFERRPYRRLKKKNNQEVLTTLHTLNIVFFPRKSTLYKYLSTFAITIIVELKRISNLSRELNDRYNWIETE